MFSSLASVSVVSARGVGRAVIMEAACCFGFVPLSVFCVLCVCVNFFVFLVATKHNRNSNNANVTTLIYNVCAFINDPDHRPVF